MHSANRKFWAHTFKKYAPSQNFYIHEFRYEYLLPYIDASDRNGLDRGCVGLVAFPERGRHCVDIGPRHLDELLPEDR